MTDYSSNAGESNVIPPVGHGGEHETNRDSGDQASDLWQHCENIVLRFDDEEVTVTREQLNCESFVAGLEARFEFHRYVTIPNWRHLSHLSRAERIILHRIVAYANGPGARNLFQLPSEVLPPYRWFDCLPLDDTSREPDAPPPAACNHDVTPMESSDIAFTQQRPQLPRRVSTLLPTEPTGFEGRPLRDITIDRPELPEQDGLGDGKEG